MGTRITRAAVLFGVVIVLAGLSGCGQKLAIDNNYPDMQVGNIQASSFTAFTHDITVTVEFTSSKADVTVGLFKESDVPDLQRVSATKAIEKQTGKEGTFSGDVTKGTPFKIIVMDPRGTTDVRLKAR